MNLIERALESKYLASTKHQAERRKFTSVVALALLPATYTGTAIDIYDFGKALKEGQPVADGIVHSNEGDPPRISAIKILEFPELGKIPWIIPTDARLVDDLKTKAVSRPGNVRTPAVITTATVERLREYMKAHDGKIPSWWRWGMDTTDKLTIHKSIKEAGDNVNGEYGHLLGREVQKGNPLYILYAIQARRNRNLTIRGEAFSSVLDVARDNPILDTARDHPDLALSFTGVRIPGATEYASKKARGLNIRVPFEIEQGPVHNGRHLATAIDDVNKRTKQENLDRPELTPNLVGLALLNNHVDNNYQTDGSRQAAADIQVTKTPEAVFIEYNPKRTSAA